MGDRKLFDLFAGGFAGNTQTAPKFAIDLQHKLNLVSHQCGLIDCRPRRIQQIAIKFGIAKFRPELPSNVGHDRVEDSKQNTHGFRMHSLGEVRVSKLGIIDSIKHFHACRDDRVVLNPLVVVIRLFQQRVNFKTQLFNFFWSLRPVRRGCL